jgi:cytochrome c oxidase subunit 2
MDAETRRGPVSGRTWAKLVGIVLAGSLVGIAIGLSLNWFPTQGSTIAHRIDTFWDVLLIVSVPVFVAVTTVVGFSVFRWRMRPGEEELDGPPIHGNTRLEVIWTAIPSVVIAGLCAYAVVLLLDIQEAPAKGTRVVDVTGQQFAWSFQARDDAGHRIDTNRLVLPIGQPVEFHVHSKDVLHDFWVPAFRLKVDAVPGITTKYSLTPNKLGRFDVVCAELCGLGHAYMRQYVNVVTPERYRQWLVAARVGTATGAINTGTGAASGAATAAVDGKQLFVAGKPATGAIACGTCHTLKAAGTQGVTGPNLDAALKPDPVSAIREAITNPNKEVDKPYVKGLMPVNYGKVLSAAELDALATYIKKSVMSG